MVDPISYFGRFPVPNPKAEFVFSHSTQFVLPALYISSTHFAIEFDSDSNKYYVSDYSRNGTYVNDELVGCDLTSKPAKPHRKELKNNDLIAIKYKNIDKITYVFSVVVSADEPPQQQPQPMDTGVGVPSPAQPLSSNVSATPASLSGKKSKNRNNNGGGKDQQEELHSSPLKKADSLTSEIFQQQLTTLQQEMKRLENKNKVITEQYDNLTKENERLIRKSRQDEKNLAELAKDLEDLKERNNHLETDTSALKARSTILQEQYDDLLIETKDWKHKHAALQSEWQEKANLLDNHRQMIEDINRLLFSEKNKNKLLESQVTSLKSEVAKSEERVNRLTNGNQALQEIINDLEVHKQHLEANVKEKEDYIQLIGKIRTIQTSKFLGLTSFCTQLKEMAQSLQGDLDQFDPIPLYASSLPPLTIDPSQTTNKSNPPTNGNGDRVMSLSNELFPLAALTPQQQQKQRKRKHTQSQEGYEGTLAETQMPSMILASPSLSQNHKHSPIPSAAMTPSLILSSNHPRSPTPATAPKGKREPQHSRLDESTQIPHSETPQPTGPVAAEDASVFYFLSEEPLSRASQQQEQQQHQQEHTQLPDHELSDGENDVDRAAAASDRMNVSKLDGLEAPFQEELLNHSKDVILKGEVDALLSQESVIRKSLGKSPHNTAAAGTLDTSNEASKVSELSSPLVGTKAEGNSHNSNYISSSKETTPNPNPPSKLSQGNHPDRDEEGREQITEESQASTNSGNKKQKRSSSTVKLSQQAKLQASSTPLKGGRTSQSAKQTPRLDPSSSQAEDTSGDDGKTIESGEPASKRRKRKNEPSTPVPTSAPAHLPATTTSISHAFTASPHKLMLSQQRTLSQQKKLSQPPPSRGQNKRSRMQEEEENIVQLSDQEHDNDNHEHQQQHQEETTPTSKKQNNNKKQKTAPATPSSSSAAAAAGHLVGTPLSQQKTQTRNGGSVPSSQTTRRKGKSSEITPLDAKHAAMEEDEEKIQKKNSGKAPEEDPAEEGNPLERAPSNGSALSSSKSLPEDRMQQAGGVDDNEEEEEERQRTVYEF